MPETISQIVVNVDRGFTEAVHHLHSLGHTHLLYVDGPARSWSGREKRRVLTKACDALHMSLTVLATRKPDFAAGRQAASDIDTATTTCLVTFNDEVALGMLCAFRDAGIDVPGQISVIGCDDSLPEGLAFPTLTSVDSSAQSLGALTASAILAPDEHRLEVITTRLVVRDSTGVVPHPFTQHPQTA